MRGQLHYHHHGRTRAFLPSFCSRLVCRRMDERVEREREREREREERERARERAAASAVLAPPPAAPVKLSLRSKRGESGRPRLVPPAPLAAANFADEGLVSTALN